MIARPSVIWAGVAGEYGYDVGDDGTGNQALQLQLAGTAGRGGRDVGDGGYGL